MARKDLYSEETQDILKTIFDSGYNEAGEPQVDDETVEQITSHITNLVKTFGDANTLNDYKEALAVLGAVKVGVGDAYYQAAMDTASVYEGEGNVLFMASVKLFANLHDREYAEQRGYTPE